MWLLHVIWKQCFFPFINFHNMQIMTWLFSNKKLAPKYFFYTLNWTDKSRDYFDAFTILLLFYTKYRQNKANSVTSVNSAKSFQPSSRSVLLLKEVVSPNRRTAVCRIVYRKSLVLSSILSPRMRNSVNKAWASRFSISWLLLIVEFR